MKNIGITQFARRQIGINQDSPMGGFSGSGGALLDILGGYADKEAKPGFAPFVRIVELHKEDLKWFLGTFREARPGETILARMESRREGELPVPVQYLLGDKEVPEAARVILYSRDQLEKEGHAGDLDDWVEWAVVSINLGPADEPMQPATLWRNYWASRDPEDLRGKGGSPHWKDRSDADFIAELDRATRYWANRGRCVRKLP